jgi:hypothetical protein
MALLILSRSSPTFSASLYVGTTMLRRISISLPHRLYDIIAMRIKRV